MELKGKKVVITGASSGIGLEMVKLLLEQGSMVVGAARNIEKLELKNENLDLKKCDVTKMEEIDELFSFALEKLGEVDIFIANAGFAYYEKIYGSDWEHISKIFDTNIISLIYCVEKMKEITGDKPFNFVATASGMSLLSLPGYSLYSSTKAAIRGFADAYRFELDREQHFQVVYPIATRTNFFKAAGDSPVPWPTQNANIVAKKILKGVIKDKKSIFPSRVFYITNLLNRIFPFINTIYVIKLNREFRAWLKKK